MDLWLDGTLLLCLLVWLDRWVDKQTDIRTSEMNDNVISDCLALSTLKEHWRSIRSLFRLPILYSYSWPSNQVTTQQQERRHLNNIQHLRCPFWSSCKINPTITTKHWTQFHGCWKRLKSINAISGALRLTKDVFVNKRTTQNTCSLKSGLL